MEVRVITVDREKEKLVLSAREVLREKAREEHDHKVAMLVPGTVMEGTVDDPDLQRFSLIFFKILHIRQRQMRSRNKSADTFQIGNHSRIHNLTYLDSDLFLLTD